MSVTLFVNDVGDLIRMLPRNFVANVRNQHKKALKSSDLPYKEDNHKDCECDISSFVIF